MEERILCAAIWYKDLDTPHRNVSNIDKGMVVCGHRHPHCISLMMALGKMRTVTYALDGTGEHEQGFLTNKNRFVDRKEAQIIAIEQNQVLDMNDLRGKELYSEDLY